MNKLTVGKSRTSAITTTEKTVDSREAKIFFVLGSVLICAMLVFAFVGRGPSDVDFTDTAIPVISSAVEGEGGEELKRPEKDTSAQAENWSIYDYIGQMFADLLFGDR